MAGVTGRDLTQGPITRTLLTFALPTLGSNILQSLNGSINAIWVGRFLGEQALAATSNANLILFLAISAVFGFGMAATILVGQSVGRGDVETARRAMGTAIGGFGGMAVLVAAIGWWLTPQIVAVMATPAEVSGLAEAYLRVIFLSLPGVFVLVLLMMGLRGVGDSLTPLWFMGLSVVLDSSLNPVFILGLGPAPRMGIAGSAVATLVANYAALIALVVTVYARDLPIRLRGAELAWLKPDRGLLRTISAKGLPMGLQMIVISFAGIAMIGLVNRHGIVVTAGYGVALQLWTYVQMPAMAIGAAVSAMAAQNIGAGRWDRVGRITRSGLIANVAITGGSIALLLVADRAAMALFLGGASPAIPVARHIQMIGSWSFILFGATMVMFATMRANGTVIGPLIVLTVAVIPVRLGFALVMERHLGVDALWWSFPLGSIAALAGATYLYQRGTWRKGGIPLPPEEGHEQAHADGDPAGRMNPTG
ncbi:MAG: MATE family efflux transporter [Sphingomonas fennica]